MKIGSFLALFAMFNIALISPAYAAELMPAGTVLPEDAMVFTPEEAQDMAKYISELEQRVEQKDDLLEQKDELIESKEEQIVSFEEYQELQDQQIEKYIEIQELDEDRIKSLSKQAKLRKLETAGAFIGGVAVAVTLIIVADQLDDKVLEATNAGASPSTARTTGAGFTVRF